MDVLETMMTKINMLKEYFDREWTADDECVRSSKCAIIDSLTRQVSNLDCSTNVTQQLVDRLDIENILYKNENFSVRSIMVEFLKYKETNKIIIRNQEADLKEKANQRGKIFSNYISKDALIINLSSIESFLPWLN